MSVLLSLLPLVAQVGPSTAPGMSGMPFPDTPARAARRTAAPPAAAPAESAGEQDCVAAADDDAEAASDAATARLAAAKGAERAEAGLCLGVAQGRLEQWTEAEAAFLAARDVPGIAPLLRARLGAMAGNAALADGAPDRALPTLERAATAARGLAVPKLETEIALDRARALVALKRPAEAETALAQARALSPADAEAWLLSATLSRREGRLAEAQERIVKAAELLPIDPAIGLEAGVIAMLAGHETAARKSWQSVLVAAPDSAEAATAQGYLAQLGPLPGTPATTGMGGR